MPHITSDDIRLLAKGRSRSTYSELLTEEREAYVRVHDELERLGKVALDAMGGAQHLKVKLTSGFSPRSGVRGYLPKDLWFAVYNEASSDEFVGMPQIFAIASTRGVEVGLAAAIHPNDFSESSIKARVRQAAPTIFRLFPEPDTPEARILNDQLGPGGERWWYRRKTRLDPGVSDFSSYLDWLRFIHSAEGQRSAGAAISRYLSSIDLERRADAVEAAVTEAAATFGHFIETITPTQQAGAAHRAPQLQPPQSPQRAWLWAPGENAIYWDELYESGKMAIGWDEVGDLKQYPTLEAIQQALARELDYPGVPINDGLACFSVAHTIRDGDLIFAKRGRKKILGVGVIVGEYIFDDARMTYKHTRSVRWTKKGEWDSPFTLPVKTLTEIVGDDLARLKDAVSLEADVEETSKPVPPPHRQPYTTEMAIEGLFMPREDFERALGIWRIKRNLVLQGAPGVGKSFVARRLAYSLMQYQDPSRIRTVQFHQAYAYEDFVQGFRPAGVGGFALKEGVFVDFCRRALEDPNETYVFIIDEINRGNLAKILGELMLLIEPDKRSSEWAVKLAYAEKADERFYVPPNVYILGLMNTADRSLAVVDYALRRRFAFLTIRPAFAAPAFRQHLQTCGVGDRWISLICERFGRLNDAIAEDSSNLGPGYCIGHSFFSSPPSLEGVSDEQLRQELQSRWYREVIESEICPLLEEYWFDAHETAAKWRDELLLAV